ncbi:MAG: hypothetical protein LBL66_07250, partial [Clostridiales bacterium]|nr:hypothetical protein [Clostridiales bacterium]
AHQIGGAVLETGQFLIWANLWSFALSAAAYGIYRLYSRLWAGGAARDARDISCGGTPAPAGETDGNGKEHTEYAPKSIPNLPEEIAAGDFPIGGGGSGRTAEEGAGGVSAPKPAAAKRMPLKNAATKPAAAKRAPLKNAALAAAFVIVIALIGCAGGLLMLNSAKDLPASVLYPMVTGGVIILSAVSGRLFFGEKTTPQILASLGLTLIGTLFLF